MSRKDSTFKELISALRYSAPHNAEIRHPLAKFSFRAVYPDAAARGRIASRELGTVYSRDILGEPGTLTAAAPRLLTDDEPPATQAAAEKTLDNVRFIAGDYLCVCVNLPKHVTAIAPAGKPFEVSIRGAATGANGWKTARPLSPPPSSGLGRGRGGGGHWRGSSDAPPARGRGGRPERTREDFATDRDRRVPPPRRRDSPPPRSADGYSGRDRDRDFGRDKRSRSRSPSYSPYRRRRYD